MIMTRKRERERESGWMCEYGSQECNCSWEKASKASKGR